MIWVVLDANVLFSAIFKSAGTQARLLDRVLTESTIVLYVSPAILLNIMKCCFAPFCDHTLQEWNISSAC